LAELVSLGRGLWPTERVTRSDRIANARFLPTLDKAAKQIVAKHSKRSLFSSFDLAVLLETAAMIVCFHGIGWSLRRSISERALV
jgi:hypothetical protein